jgi:hypothetical protein
MELHNIPIKNRNLNNFLFSKFYSVDNDKVNNGLKSNMYNNINFMEKKEYIIEQDFNYMTGQPYTNIFELRKLKNFYLMNIMPKKVKNYILINYEDLLYNYDDVLNLIKNKFNLKQKYDTFKKIVKYKKSDKYKFVTQRKILFSSNIIDLIWKYLDVEQEKQLGYIKGDNNSYFINKSKPD